MSKNMTTAEFDPAEHTVPEVVEHIEAHPDDAARVIEAEHEGRARKGVLEHGGSDGPRDYLGRSVTSGADQLGREIEGGVDYLGRAIG